MDTRLIKEWKIINRANGKVNLRVEDLEKEEYQPDQMAKFFEDRSHIADLPEPLPLDPVDTSKRPEINITITDQQIDE